MRTSTRKINCLFFVVVYLYKVTNNGPSAVEEFKVDINMVSLYRKDRRYSYLLYLLHVEVSIKINTKEKEPLPFIPLLALND